MNPLTLEWIEKAEGDINTGERELRVRRHPNYDAACFHAQQTAEKYLKAWCKNLGTKSHALITWLTWYLSVLRPMRLSLPWNLISGAWMVIPFGFVILVNLRQKTKLLWL